MREQDNPFSRLQLIADLSRPPQVKFNDLATMVGTGVMKTIRLTLMCALISSASRTNAVITAFTIQTENKDLVFTDSGDSNSPYQHLRQSNFGGGTPRNNL